MGGGDFALDMMVAGGLGVMGLIPVVFYLIHRRDRAPLWLGLFCLILSGHFLFGAQRSLNALFVPNLGSELQARLEALSWYLSLPILAFFIRELYRLASSRQIVRGVVIVCFMAAAAAAVLPLPDLPYVAYAMRWVTLATVAWLALLLVAVGWQRRSPAVALLGLMPLTYPVVIFDLMQNTALRFAFFPLGVAAYVIAPVAVLTRRVARAISIEELRLKEVENELGAKLRSQTKLTYDLVDSVPVGVSARDPQGRYVFVNRTWEKWFGVSREQVIGTSVTERLPPETGEHVMAMDRQALEAGPDSPPTVGQLEIRGRHYMQTRRVMSDESGNVIGLVVASVDATEQREQDRKLKEQMAFTRAAIDDNPNAMYIKNREGRYVHVNDAWLKMLGTTREECMGRTLMEVFPDDPESPRYHQMDLDLLASGEGWREIESERRDSQGNVQWLIVRKAVLRSTEGEVMGLIGTNTDITRLKRYEAELADRNKFVSSVLEAMPVSVAIRDANGRFVQVNRTWEKYIGIPRHQAIGKRTDELPGYKGNPDLEEVARTSLEIDREIIARGPGSPIEPIERTRLGRTYLNTRRLLVSAGKPVGIIAVAIDVTDQRKIAEELALEQRRMAIVMRASKIGIVDWDGVTHDTYYSPRFREILGYEPDADTSAWPDYFKVLLHPDDRKQYTRTWQDFIKGKGPEGREAEFLGPHEHRLLRKDGSYAWVEVSGIALRDKKGFVTRWIAATTDITERRSQAAILKTTLENIDQGISMTDRDLRIIAHNRRLLELLDLPGDLFGEGFTLEDAFRFNAMRGEYGPGDPEEQVASRLALARKFEPHAFERKRPGGQVLAIRGQPLPDGGGFVTTYSDVTEQKRAEEQLRQSVALREEVERMSRHDLKTPINSVIAVSRMLRESSKLAPEDSELLATVERAGYRILNMVNLSLDLFRMEQGTYEFHPQTVDLDEVASKVATDLQGQAASKNVHVEVKRRGLAVARAEEVLCYSLLANLVKNAIEAAPEGTTVTIELDREDERAVARVHNEGVVPDDMRARFFQKYATAGKVAGLGLGTYSASLLARSQGGKITLDTSAEAGTTLTVRLQAARSEEVRRRDALPRIEDVSNLPPLPPLRVLVADDDEFNRLVLRRHLPAPPLKVSLAVNGRAALTSAQRDWPDVVLMDLEMPVMDGYEATRQLREIEKARHRKRPLVIAISSNDEESIIQRALAAGCDHYLLKPAPRETLWRILAGVSVPVASGNVAPADARATDEVLLDPDLEAALPGFLASRRDALDEMPMVLAANDREAFRRLAHRLAGSFALYGFKWASQESKVLEREAPDGKVEDLVRRTAKLREHLDAVKIRVAPKDNALT
jgi:PAS domain S-box-containing protein